jgi:hypothetical protein
MKFYENGLTNIQIIQLCHSFHLPLIACIAKDQLSMYNPTREGFYIINLGNSYTAGSHWVCLFVNKHFSLYMDSFAYDPPESIITFINRLRTSSLIVNSIQLQDLSSHMCGYYCIAFMQYVTYGKFDKKKIPRRYSITPTIFIYWNQLFHHQLNKLKSNDLIIKKMVQKIY